MLVQLRVANEVYIVHAQMEERMKDTADYL